MLYDPKWEEKIEVKLEPWQAILLSAAADIIETEGWVKGTYHSSEGYCTIGALRKAATLPQFIAGDSSPQMTNDYKEACVSLSKKIGTYISLWNDRSSNKEIVIATLRDAAKGE